MFQQATGIGNPIISHKEPMRMEFTIFRNESFNGLLTYSGDQSGWIETSRAVRVKGEVTQPTGSGVPQDKFVFDLCMLGIKQIGVFIDKPPQALSIWGIGDHFYFPEGFWVRESPCSELKHKGHEYWDFTIYETSSSLSVTFVEEIPHFSDKLVKLKWITFLGEVEKREPLNKLCRCY